MYTGCESSLSGSEPRLPEGESDANSEAIDKSDQA